MADRPETLEETQARLARVREGQAQAPSVSVPIPTVIAPPATPYGAPAPGAPDPGALGGEGEFGAAPTRPDPYSGAGFAPATSSPARPGRAAAILGISFGAVALVIVGAITAYTAFDGGGSPEPYQPGDDPVYSEEWQTFPGVSYVDPETVLAQPSYEQTVTGLESLLAQYRDTLTAEFGLTWSMRYESYTGIESNGYGGDSMLYYWDSGSWQGQATISDPSARARIYDLFVELSAANGGDGVLLRNDLYSDDAESSRVEFGAADLDDQALWSFFDAFPSLAGGYLSVDVIDRSIPVDDGFDGDYMFTFDESTDTLFVTISGFAGPLLKEGDRDAFEKALEPYHGDYEP